MPKVAGYTLGCKVSQYETEVVLAEFSRRGFQIAEQGEPADACIINSCTVTAESDRKSRQTVRRAKKQNPDACIVVFGCYSQRSPEEVAAIEGVDMVFGTQLKTEIPEAVERFLKGERGEKIRVTSLEGARFEPMCLTTHRRTRAYVKIEDGCECRCSYCAISAARGPVRSKPVCEVISEVEELARRGTREVVLTGIETGSWGRDLDTDMDLADLIVLLDKRKSVSRLRLGSLAPELCGEKFASKLVGTKIMVPHFHLSMQSGSDRILALMRRRYTCARALENIERLREVFPGACFTTDLMVGFPGETEEDFLATMELVRRARFLDVHVFAYSKREGTPAATMDAQVPSDVKKERSRRLTELKNQVRDGVLSEIVERAEPLDVILETYSDGAYTAHSDSFAEICVAYPRGHEGEELKVLPVSHKNGIITAKAL